MPVSSASGAPASGVDPRSTITHESFAVAPELIGIPLARPARRAAAMLLDLLPLAVLVNANAFFFAVAAALLLWRASRSESPAPATAVLTRPRRFRKALLRSGAVLFVFLAVLRAADAINDRFQDESRITVNGTEVAVDLGLRDLATVSDLRGLQNATDPSAAQRHARRLAEWVHSRSDSEEAQQSLARMLIAMVEAEPAAVDALRAELGTMLDVAEAPIADDSAVIAYGRALARRDPVESARLLPRARAAIAGSRILELEIEADRLRDEAGALAERLEENDSRGLVTATLASIANDLGIGFGWAALYFTAFLALWNGQTPGKRLMGIQVIRLDGKPLGWWLSFERFGGYAAAIWTGLLGFLQILWDRNRQGIHDKIAETVVIRSPRGRRYDPRR